MVKSIVSFSIQSSREKNCTIEEARHMMQVSPLFPRNLLKNDVFHLHPPRPATSGTLHRSTTSHRLRLATRYKGIRLARLDVLLEISVIQGKSIVPFWRSVPRDVTGKTRYGNRVQPAHNQLLFTKKDDQYLPPKFQGLS
jgi:hypothetical protein